MSHRLTKTLLWAAGVSVVTAGAVAIAPNSWDVASLVAQDRVADAAPTVPPAQDKPALQEKDSEQDPPVRPVEPQLPPRRGGIGMFPGIRQDNFAMSVNDGNGSLSLSQTTRNGATVTKLSSGKKVIEIEENADGIFLNVNTRYTLDDLETLKETKPELAAALQAFPAQADGDELEISVQSKKYYEAINEEDLKSEHPEAFKAYREVKDQIENRASGGIGGGLGMMNENFGGFGLAPMDVGAIEQRMEKMQKRIQEDMQRIHEEHRQIFRGFGQPEANDAPQAAPPKRKNSDGDI